MGFEILFDFIGELADGDFFFYGKAFDAAQYFGEFAGAADIFNFEVLESYEVFYLAEFFFGLGC